MKVSNLCSPFVFITFCLATQAELVQKRDWTKSHFDADFGDSQDDCPIWAHCEALHRLVISCDSTSTATGCGACLNGYSHPKALGEMACVKSSAPSVSVAASLGLDEASLVDQISAANSAIATAAADADKDAELQLSARADPGNGTSGDPLPGRLKRYHPGNGDVVFYIIVGTTTGLGLLLIIICAICWFKYNAVAKQVDDEFVDSDFASHQLKGSSGQPGDGKLALSAQMYHYQHQKQQMMALEKSNGENKHGASDIDSDLENEEADFTVYECPGLAPTGEMEVRNPLFKEELDQQQQQQPPPQQPPVAPK